MLHFNPPEVDKAAINTADRGFDLFLKDLTPWTYQSDLLSNNCQKKIDPVKFRRTSKSISLGLESFITFTVAYVSDCSFRPSVVSEFIYSFANCFSFENNSEVRAVNNTEYLCFLKRY